MVLFSRNTSSTVKEEVSETLRILIMDDLGRYLGMPTINGRVTKQTFKHIMDRVDRRLAG